MGEKLKLRERTIPFKIIDGEIEDPDKEIQWVDVFETPEGGARIPIKVDDPEYMNRLYAKLAFPGVKAVPNEKGDEVILVDGAGVQIPFETIYVALNS